MANFIPPIPIGQFKPSSEAIASWLYEVWKYLQENPIPRLTDVVAEATEIVQNYVAVNVPPLIAAAIDALQYSDFVDGTTLPVYRASNDEIDNSDLLEAWAEGCRFALVDDESFFIMIKNGETITLLQVLTEEQSTGVISVNGQSGIVVLTSSNIGNQSNVSGNTITDAFNALNNGVHSALNGIGIPYGICETASNVPAKQVTVSPTITQLIDGQLMLVRFANPPTPGQPVTLNVNGLGAGNLAEADGIFATWNAGETLLIRYTPGTSGVIAFRTVSHYGTIADATWQQATIIYEGITQGHIYYKQIGRMVFVTLEDIHINAAIPTNTKICSGLPVYSQNGPSVFIVQQNGGGTMRLQLTEDGGLRLYYDGKTAMTENFYGQFQYTS